MEVKNWFTVEEKYPHLMLIKLKLIGSNTFDTSSLRARQWVSVIAAWRRWKTGSGQCMAWIRASSPAPPQSLLTMAITLLPSTTL